MKYWLAQFKMRFWDWMSVDKQFPCHSFGGVVRHTKLPDPPAYEVRVCTKNRWHVDSHAYEFVRFPYKYPMEGI